MPNIDWPHLIQSVTCLRLQNLLCPCVGACLSFSQTYTVKVPAVCSNWQSTPQTAHLLSPWFSPASAGPTNNTITQKRPTTSQSFQTRTVRHDIRQRNKSCHCMATEIRLANRFHVYSWNISCSDCSLWWWGKSSISNDLHFKIHPKINRKPMTGLKHGRNVGPPAGPSQKPCSHMCTTCKNKSCHCMATEIRLANRFHVYSWNISCSDYSLWWWGKSSISNDLHF